MKGKHISEHHFQKLTQAGIGPNNYYFQIDDSTVLDAQDTPGHVRCAKASWTAMPTSKISRRWHYLQLMQAMFNTLLGRRS
jgi:hypothetical protein